MRTLNGGNILLWTEQTYNRVGHGAEFIQQNIYLTL